MPCRSRSCWRAISKRTASDGASRSCSNRAMPNASPRASRFPAKAGASPPPSIGYSRRLPFALAADRTRIGRNARLRSRLQRLCCAPLAIGLQPHRHGRQKRRDDVERVAAFDGCGQGDRGLVVDDQRHAKYEAHFPPAAPGERRDDDRSHDNQETERWKQDIEGPRERSRHRTVPARLLLFCQIRTRPFEPEGSMRPGIWTLRDEKRDKKIAAVG